MFKYSSNVCFILCIYQIRDNAKTIYTTLIASSAFEIRLELHLFMRDVHVHMAETWDRRWSPSTPRMEVKRRRIIARGSAACFFEILSLSHWSSPAGYRKRTLPPPLSRFSRLQYIVTSRARNRERTSERAHAEASKKRREIHVYSVNEAITARSALVYVYTYIHI